MPELDPDNLSVLKVTELRAELKKRSLPNSGLKQVLVDRLRDFLLKEKEETAEEETAEEETAEEETAEEEPEAEARPEAGREKKEEEGEKAESEAQPTQEVQATSEPNAPAEEPAKEEPVAAPEAAPEPERQPEESSDETKEDVPAALSVAPEIAEALDEEVQSGAVEVEKPAEDVHVPVHPTAEEEKEIAAQAEHAKDGMLMVQHEGDLGNTGKAVEEPAEELERGDAVKLTKEMEERLEEKAEEVNGEQAATTSEEIQQQAGEKREEVALPETAGEKGLAQTVVQEGESPTLAIQEPAQAPSEEPAAPAEETVSAKAASPAPQTAAPKPTPALGKPYYAYTDDFDTSMHDAPSLSEPTQPSSQSMEQPSKPSAPPETEHSAINPSASLDSLDTLKRKRRSKTPPPSTERASPRSPSSSPTTKRARPDPAAPTGSPSRRTNHPQKDARFKGLFNQEPAREAADEPLPSARSGGDGEEDEVPVSPSLHPATRGLYIRDLLRPLNENVLRAHILSLATRGVASTEGTIETFYLDSIKSHALILFSNTTAATRVRVGVHGKIFPNEKTRKQLWADYVPEEKVQEWIEREKGVAGGRARWEVVYDDLGGEVRAELVEVGPGGGGPPGRLSGGRGVPGRTVSGVRDVDISAAPTGPRRTEGIARRPEPASEKRIVKNLDELFLSTKTKPKLYYLPVDSEIARRRLEARARERGRY